MRTQAGRVCASRLAYWGLTRAQRRIVRRIERTCRSVGDPLLDAVARARLDRAARRQRLIGRLLRRSNDTDELRPSELPPSERLERLACTMRHPSRGPAGPRPRAC